MHHTRNIAQSNSLWNAKYAAVAKGGCKNPYNCERWKETDLKLGWNANVKELKLGCNASAKNWNWDEMQMQKSWNWDAMQMQKSWKWDAMLKNAECWSDFELLSEGRTNFVLWIAARTEEYNRAWFKNLWSAVQK